MELSKVVAFLLVLEVILAVKLEMFPPEPETYVFFDGRSTFSCSSDNGSINVEWFLNDTLYDPSNDQYEDWDIVTNQIFLNLASITIRNIVEEINNTVINCSAVVNGDRFYSNNSTLLLQGVPDKVSNVTASIMDSSIFISWEAPFSLDPTIFFGVEVISSLVELGIVYEEIMETNYTITCPNNCRVACSNWTISISPINRVAQVGEAQVITLFNEGHIPELSNYELIERSINGYHLLLTVTEPLCKITDFYIVNKNIESGNYNQRNFKNFVLQNRHLTSGNYVYELDVNFEKRFEYNISMTLESNNKRIQWTESISTHSSYNITLMEYSNSFLRMQLVHNKHSDGSTGAFLSLLHCTDSSCDNIDYDNSVYALIHSTEPISLESDYKRGDYLMYIFDTDTDGALLPSIGNKCYSKTGQMVHLDISLPDNLRVEAENFCSLIYNNNTVGSSCQSKTLRDDTQKQLIVQSAYALGSQMVSISNVTNITERGCMQYEGASYGIVTSVDDLNVLPIGRGHIIFTTDSKKYSNEEVCTPSEFSDWIWILIGVFIAIVVLVILCIVCQLLVSLCIYYTMRFRDLLASRNDGHGITGHYFKAEDGSDSITVSMTASINENKKEK